MLISHQEGSISQLNRVRDVLIDQTQDLRKRGFVKELNAKRQEGAYWGIGKEFVGQRQALQITEEAVYSG